MSNYITDKTKTKCRGKWKEHGELELEGGGNNAGTCYWIFKKCKRCNRGVFSQYFNSREEYWTTWTEERKRHLGL